MNEIPPDAFDARLVGPCSNANSITFHQSGRWLIRIKPDGQIELNPDIPQDILVRDFVQLCNQLWESTGFKHLRVWGVSRMADNPQAAVLYFDRTPTDEELRAIHERFRK